MKCGYSLGSHVTVGSAVILLVVMVRYEVRLFSW